MRGHSGIHDKPNSSQMASRTVWKGFVSHRDAWWRCGGKCNRPHVVAGSSVRTTRKVLCCLPASTSLIYYTQAEGGARGLTPDGPHQPDPRVKPESRCDRPRLHAPTGTLMRETALPQSSSLSRLSLNVEIPSALMEDPLNTQESNFLLAA